MNELKDTKATEVRLFIRFKEFVVILILKELRLKDLDFLKRMS